MKSHLKRILCSPIFITGCAFALRMFLVYLAARLTPIPTKSNLPFGFEVGQVAKSIAEGKGFSSPLGPPDTGPTAWFTPIYPYLLAAIFKLFGIFSGKSHVVIQTLNCAFAALTVIPIHGIAKRTFGEGVATGAAWMWVFLPTALYYPVVWVWDTALTALIFSLIFWATLALREKQSVRLWAGYGALWAVGTLINPVILSLFPFLLGWLIWDARKVSVSWARPAAAALLVFAMCLVPWTIRNYRVFGKIIVLRSNFGLELWLGNNTNVADTMGEGQHPTDNLEEAAKYKRMGEVSYMAEKEQEAVSFMRTHPVDALSLAFRRFQVTWLVTTGNPLDIWSGGNPAGKAFLVLNCFISVLCLFGALLANRARIPEAAPFAMVLLIFPLVFYVTHTSLRYRFPMDPIMLILAASTVAHVISVAKTRNLNSKKAADPVSSLPAL